MGNQISGNKNADNCTREIPESTLNETEKQKFYEKIRQKRDPFGFFDVKKRLPTSLYVLVKQGRNISKGKKSHKKTEKIAENLYIREKRAKLAVSG